MGLWHRRRVCSTVVKRLTVQPGGQDSQLVVPPRGATWVDTRYLLKTADEQPAHIAISTTGWRDGPADVLAALRDPERAGSVDPSTYSFRCAQQLRHSADLGRGTVKLETGDERYAHLNSKLWVFSGCRKGATVIYDAYLVQ